MSGVLRLLGCAFLLGGSLYPMRLDAAGEPNPGPWRLARAAGVPEGLDVSGSHRTRYENLDGQFRVGRSGGDQILVLRTTLRLEAKSEAVSLVGELSDSRQELADADTPIDTTMVNAVELLQGYVAMRFAGPSGETGRNELRVGRQAIDLGSRRFVARNDFRNTVNAFTGLHYEWQRKDGPTVRLFYVLPVVRRPTAVAALRANRRRFDDESFDLRLWGLHVQRPNLLWGATGEAYVLGLRENDSVHLASRNRQLVTPGLRLARRPAKGAWDFDFEGVVQVGRQRNSTAASDTRDLDHVAWFGHWEAGYTFARPWSPRVALLYDHASGDNDPGDGDSNRFDTLFGARRFDHGPAGIYGAFARANIRSPGLRGAVRPVPPLEVMTTWRPYWLASDTDAWTTSGMRDPSGNSGSFVGQQLEARVRWDVRPGNLRFEAGAAWLFAGEFIKNAPNATHRGDTTASYLSAEITF